jgi:post-segregation antitoxin (ccd killing protein)
MAKDKITVTIDRDVLAELDADAEAAGLNRSEFVQRALVAEHYRRQIERWRPAEPAPALAPPEPGEAEDEFTRRVLDWQRRAVA